MKIFFSKFVFNFLIISLFFLLGITVSFARMSSSNYTIYADVFSVGGLETGSSANYKIQDTLGEALILSATSTSDSYGAKAGFREMYPDQYLTVTIANTSINFGILNEALARSSSHTIVIDTNAINGFTTTVTGNTLTSGSYTINAIGAGATASNPGTEQFGINLVANSSPSVGADLSGTSPAGLVASTYNTADNFAFNSGDTIATASTDINETTFTVSYIANISSATEAGNYSTTLTYATTANF